MQGEKCVKALFSLASKIAPTVIFIDEMDSMLSKRASSSSEHEAMRKIKNEFMSSWDGMKTRSEERVIVMGCTNRPQDLDEAVVRRLPRRLMVPLPNAGNREKILRIQLKNEELAPATGEDEFDFAALARETNDYSGSDLKNMCVAAAYRPIREIIAAERAAAKKDKSPAGEDERDKDEGGSDELRKLKMDDFIKAMDEVPASVAADAPSTNEMEQWAAMYASDGSRERQVLTYFM